MLDHLLHVPAHDTAAVLEHLPTVDVMEWVVYTFAPEKTAKGTKHAMYQRMWKVRKTGCDAMVRTEHDEYVLVARRFV